MPYIANNKYKEIREAAKQGNEKALMILQAMRKMSPQADVDRLIGDYYKVDTVEPEQEPQVVESQIQPEEPQQEVPVELQPEVTEQMPENNVVDITETLDGEMTDLLDENDVEDETFGDFISQKKKSALRSTKNADYFKAYDQAGRQNYIDKKVNAYKEKFNPRLKDVERSYKDTDTALSNYSQLANDMLDDDIELDMGKVNDTYNDFTGNETVMHSFGRHWDEEDNATIKQALEELVGHYGKKNVIAALNTLKSDNEAYKGYRNNQIDTEISRYSKNIENLLK